MLLKMRTRGCINIPNGRVDITDPCYNKNAKFRMNDIAIKPGEYKCRFYTGSELEQFDIDEITEFATEFNTDVEKTIANEREDIKRRCFIIELRLKDSNFPLNSPKWRKIGEIGVDAGLAGFFWNKPDFAEIEWKDFCSKMDFEKIAYLDKDMGFWSSSGYGDGLYNVYAIKENDEIIALKIHF